MMKKKIIMVAGESTLPVAEFLTALMSQSIESEIADNNEKKEQYNTAVWTEKEYKDNRHSIVASPDSRNYVIFIGGFKDAKDCYGYSSSVYSKLGMNIKWLGKKAVLYVNDYRYDRVKKEYEEFLAYSKENELDFTPQDINKGEHTKAEKALLATSPILLFGPAGAIAGALSIGAKLRRRDAFKKAVRKQKYHCLAKVFYDEFLNKFLEN